MFLGKHTQKTLQIIQVWKTETQQIQETKSRKQLSLANIDQTNKYYWKETVKKIY